LGEHSNTREKGLMKNTFIIFLGTICTKLITFLLLPLYTGVLSTTEYGTVDLFNTLISLALPIIGLQINQGVFRFLIDNRKDENKKKELISTSINFLFVAVFISCIVFIAVQHFIVNEYKYLLMINIVAAMWSDLLLQISRGLGENKKYSIAGIITALINTVVSVLLLVVFKMGVTAVLIGLLAGYVSGIIFLLLALKIPKLYSPKLYKKKTKKELLHYSLPLVPNQISWWIFGVSDRVIVSIILGLSYTGILSVAYKFSGAYIIIYNIVNLSWTESMAIHIKDVDIEEYFNKMFRAFLKFFYMIGLIIIAVMPFAFRILINSAYNEAYNLIPITIVAAICQVIVGLISVVYVSKNDTKAIAQTAIFAAIINVVSHLLLINFVGIYAAVISTFISYFVFTIYRLHDVNKRYIKVHYNIKAIVLNLIVLAALIVTYYLNICAINIIAVIFTIIYGIIFNKNTIIFIKNTIIKKIKRG